MAKYTRDLAAQCAELNYEATIARPVVEKWICPPEDDEAGHFHANVRPIFENARNQCSSCHGPAQTSPYANLTLGGYVSSRCVAERLKRASHDGGQFKLIEPGDPDKSWLYLKASGKATAAGCISSDVDKPCNSATMPPSGKTMTDTELAILRTWIADGAKYP